MQKNNFERQIVRAIRRRPVQVLGTAWLAVVIFTIAAIGVILPNSNHNFLTKAGLFGNDGATVNATPDPNIVARTSYADVVERVAPSVVTVRVESKSRGGNAASDNPLLNDPRFREFFGGRLPQQQPQVQRALGSGVIVTADGTILTNNHVVEDADKIRVELPDRRVFTAKVVGTDKPSDLAVIKIDATNLPVLPIGNSDAARVGDVVLAIGYPLGLSQTVTSGIISAKGRSTGISDGSFEDFIQTDAPINHGNSGGALISLNGELIGINSQILSPSGGSIGIGFAIPSNMAKGVMEQLVKTGKVHRGMLGVTIQNVTSDLAQQFGLKEIRGVIVNNVQPNSPADKAGVKQGDVIVGVGGVAVADDNELRNRVAQTAPGSSVDLTVVRNGQEQTLKATLDEFKAQKIAAEDNGDDDQNGDGNSQPSAPTDPKLGLSLQQITPQTAAQFGLKNITQGVVVTGVQAGGAADDAGISEGDVIQQINRQPVKSLADVQTALAKSDGKAALLLINHKGRTLFVTVQ